MHVQHMCTLFPPSHALQPVSEVMRLIQEDDRLDRPKNCPEEVYAIMKSCWEAEPRDRPMFKQLLEQLTELVQSA